MASQLPNQDFFGARFSTITAVEDATRDGDDDLSPSQGQCGRFRLMTFRILNDFRQWSCRVFELHSDEVCRSMHISHNGSFEEIRRAQRLVIAAKPAYHLDTQRQISIIDETPHIDAGCTQQGPKSIEL